jgi:hypothetical protein
MGVFFGLVFAGFTKGNKEGGNSSVRETIVIIKERIIVRDRGGNNNSSSSNDDPMGLFIVLVAAMVLAIYLYAVYAELVIYYSSIVAFNIIAFGVAALAFSAIQGRISGTDWLMFTCIPVAVVSFSLVLLYQAKMGILSDAKETAESVGAFKFYFDTLDDSQRNWIIPQLIGLVGTVAFLFFSSVLVLHNIAALQVVYDGALRSFWRSIFVITNAFSGVRILIFLIVLGAISFFSLDGTGYQLILDRNR